MRNKRIPKVNYLFEVGVYFCGFNFLKKKKKSNVFSVSYQTWFGIKTKSKKLTVSFGSKSDTTERKELTKVRYTNKYLITLVWHYQYFEVITEPSKLVLEELFPTQ